MGAVARAGRGPYAPAVLAPPLPALLLPAVSGAAAPPASGLFRFAGSDIVLLVVYGAFLLYVTVRIFGPHRTDVGEYLVASRSVTLPGFVATLVSTWYG